MINTDSVKKLCPKCGVETDRNSFGRCKPCDKRRNAAWSAANRETLKVKKVAYRAANIDHIKAYEAAYYAKNHERKNAAERARYAANPDIHNARREIWRLANVERDKANSAAWREANSEKIKANDAAYAKENPEYFRIKNQNRRARKRSNGGVLSKNLSEKLFKLQKGKCACCGLPLGENYHLDHIMPIALGGLNIDSNIQLLRQRCNNQKQAKHPVDFMQSRGFLL